MTTDEGGKENVSMVGSEKPVIKFLVQLDTYAQVLDVYQRHGGDMLVEFIQWFVGAFTAQQVVEFIDALIDAFRHDPSGESCAFEELLEASRTGDEYSRRLVIVAVDPEPAGPSCSMCDHRHDCACIHTGRTDCKNYR